MKLSVIIPVYQVEKTLRPCVDSVLQQAFKDYEIILVDDGSPDNCPQICNELAKEDPRIKVIHKENGGLSSARNAGLDVAKGDYVLFIDSDDFIWQDTLAPLVYCMDTHPEYDLLEFPVFEYYQSPRQKVLGFEERTYSDGYSYWYEHKAYAHAYAWNKICKRSLYDKVRFPDGKKFEDVLTTARLLSEAKVIATCSRGMYYYNWNEEGITNTASGADLLDLLEAHKQVANEFMPYEHLTMDVLTPYYMKLVNIQLDIWRMGEKQVHLKELNIPFTQCMNQELSTNERLKFIFLKLFGLQKLCKVAATLSHLFRLHV